MLKREDREEREGLLSGDFLESSSQENRRKWSKKSLFIISLCFVGLLIAVVVGPRYWSNVTDGLNTPANIIEEKEKNLLMSNGTHDFQPTVLMVSIDGLRADYLDRGLTPHLLEISRVGLRAKWMQPIFPTITFPFVFYFFSVDYTPSEWFGFGASEIIGLYCLYAESHAIVENLFWDPESNDTFRYYDPNHSWNASWWHGEPVWETAHRAGLTTANLMWPGPPVTRNGVRPTYYVPFQNKVPLKTKLKQILNWIDMPLKTRPQLILAYEPSLDQAGHAFGPGSKQVNDTLVYVDTFARDLHKALSDRNLSEVIDIVFVSDHGMTDTRNVEFIYLENLIGQNLVDSIDHEDGSLSMGLRFRHESDALQALDLLNVAASSMPEKLSVYTKETMPPSYHYTNNIRIAPLYIVPHIGFAVTSVKEGEGRMSKGNHGYDNSEPSMFATFVSDGPFSSTIKHRKRELSDTTGWVDATGEYHIIEGFSNLEIYGLICKLLGIESFGANTNGTKGFWEKYF